VELSEGGGDYQLAEDEDCVRGGHGAMLLKVAEEGRMRIVGHDNVGGELGLAAANEPRQVAMFRKAAQGLDLATI